MKIDRLLYPYISGEHITLDDIFLKLTAEAEKLLSDVKDALKDTDGTYFSLETSGYREFILNVPVVRLLLPKLKMQLNVQNSEFCNKILSDLPLTEEEEHHFEYNRKLLRCILVVEELMEEYPDEEREIVFLTDTEI